MMKQFALVVIVLVCLSLTAFAADVPKGDFFGGFSVEHISSGPIKQTPLGWQTSVAGNLNSVVGIVADFGGQYKTISGSKTNNYQYLFGPRFNARQEKATFFVEALYGGNRHHDPSSSESHFAMAYGGGIDVKAGKVNVRVIQFDWIPVKDAITKGTWLKNHTRWGFGIDVPFGKK